MSRALDDCSFARLTRAAGLATTTAEKASFVAEGFRWVERGWCGCVDSQPVQRLIRLGHDRARRCAKCSQPVHPQPFYSHDSFPARLLEKDYDRPLRALGAAGCRGVLVHHGAKTVLLTNPQLKARV
jgi:hypothetical protein